MMEASRSNDSSVSIEERVRPLGFWLPPVAVAGLIGALWMRHQVHWRFLSDDAYISFRYARNLAETGHAVFNVAPLEFVEGYTNPLWVAFLAAAMKMTSFMPDQVAPFATMLASLLCLLAIAGVWAKLSEQHRLGWPSESGSGSANSMRSSLWRILPCLPLVASPNFMVWAHGGLETSMATALGLWSLYFALTDRWRSAGLLLAAAALTRLDSLAWVGMGLLTIRVLLIPADRDRAFWRDVGRRDLIAIAWIVIPIACHFLWRRYYYGEWLPNTWFVKRHGTLLRDTWGLAYFLSWCRDLHLVWVLPLVGMLRFRHCVLATPIAIVLVYGWWVGGDFMAYQRFYLPATVMVVPLILWLFADLITLLQKGVGSRADAKKPQADAFDNAPAVGVLVASVVVALLLGLELPGRIEKDRREAWLDHRWEGVTSMDSFSRIRAAAGGEMAKIVDPSTWASAGAAGAFPYASRLPTFDIFGLVDPVVARTAIPRSGEHARPGHQLTASVEHIHLRAPSLQCHIGWASTELPNELELRRRVRGEHRWRCVSVGPLPENRPGDGPIARHHYCCVEAIPD